MPNRMAICEWTLPVGGTTGMQLAAEAGFCGMQLGDQGGAAAGYPLMIDRVRESYCECAQSLGIELPSIHLHALTREGDMLFPPSTARGERAREAIRNGVYACQKMHSPVLMLAAFFASFVQNSYQFDVFADHMRYACDIGEDMGVQIALESILPVPRQLEMLERLDNRFQIAYDNGNPLIFGSGDPAQEVRALGRERISFVHAKDKTPDYKSGCPLGEGVCKIPQTAEALREIGWSGWVVNENFFHQFNRYSGESFPALIREDRQRQMEFFGSVHPYR